MINAKNRVFKSEFILRELENKLFNPLNNLNSSSHSSNSIILTTKRDEVFSFLVLQNPTSNTFEKMSSFEERINRAFENNIKNHIYTGLIEVNPKRIHLNSQHKKLSTEQDLRDLFNFSNETKINLVMPTLVDELIYNFQKISGADELKINNWNKQKGLSYNNLKLIYEFEKSSKTIGYSLGNLKKPDALLSNDFSLIFNYVTLKTELLSNPVKVVFEKGNYERLIHMRSANEAELKYLDDISKTPVQKIHIKPKAKAPSNSQKQQTPQPKKTALGYDLLPFSRELERYNNKLYVKRNRNNKKIVPSFKKTYPLSLVEAYDYLTPYYQKKLDKIQPLIGSGLSLLEGYGLTSLSSFNPTGNKNSLPTIEDFFKLNGYDSSLLDGPDFSDDLRQINEDYLHHLQNLIEPIMQITLLGAKQTKNGEASRIKNPLIYFSIPKIKYGFLQKNPLLDKSKSIER